MPISTVETLETLEMVSSSSHLRRWLGVPRSLSSIALYGRSNKLQLPLKSLEEGFKATKARVVIEYRDSSDPKVSKAGIEVRTGRKWSAEEAVRPDESKLHYNRLVGVVTQGRAGLGSFSTLNIGTSKGKVT